MKKFSEREGYKSFKDVLQIDTIDKDLRNRLWNALFIHYFDVPKEKLFLIQIKNEDLRRLFKYIWLNYFKKPLDNMGDVLSKIYNELRDYYFECVWYEVYDLIEFIANNTILAYNIKTNGKSTNERFTSDCNLILEQEKSAYRFVDKKITKITSKTEIQTIEQSITKTDKYTSVNEHLKRSLALFADRKNPDYRNSIKESISAVEALCRIIAEDEKATLGQALKKVKEKTGLHPALEKSFSSLYGYTSSAEGIRHALLEESNLSFDDAKFFLVSCSAFINYLISKSDKLNVDLA